MRWTRVLFLAVVASLLAVFLHYTLPQRDIVRITDTEVIRTDLSGWNRMFYAQGDTAGAQSDSRDIRFIIATFPDGGVMNYRNEDTGFGWPPYFKLNSADLHAEASNLRSTEAAPEWVAITHYGWRSNLLSVYPNAVSIRPVAGPEVRLVPWPSIVILLCLAGVLFVIWRIWERFEDRVIDPAADAFAVRWAKLKDRLGGRR